MGYRKLSARPCHHAHAELAAAVNIAMHEWKVGVFLAASEAGGAVKTREMTLPGLRHDRRKPISPHRDLIAL
jgi:hypothetical protein